LRTTARFVPSGAQGIRAGAGARHGAAKLGATRAEPLADDLPTVQRYGVMDLLISDWTFADASRFMAAEWPAYDAPLGIDWSRRQEIVLVGTRGVPVGVACGVAIGGLGELKQLLVRAEHARTGVGSQLLMTFEQRCRSLGCHKLRLETAEYQARPFYERHGYAVAATLTDDRFGRDWYVMEKRLVPASTRG
jgi:GNAT superfamily N-acetyltransferase